VAKFKTGDLVTLKSGGPAMTVDDPAVDVSHTGTQGYRVRCVFIKGWDLSALLLHADMLKAVAERPPPPKLSDLQ